MSKAGKKLIKAAKEALAVCQGKRRMMCRACGSGSRPPEWHCDCTKIEHTRHLQCIVPVPDEPRS